MCMCMCRCIYIYTHIICIYIYIYVYIYIYIYIYTHTCGSCPSPRTPWASDRLMINIRFLSELSFLQMTIIIIILIPIAIKLLSVSCYALARVARSWGPPAPAGGCCRPRATRPAVPQRMNVCKYVNDYVYEYV